jgi:RNase adaptor protein for sRNA GlmZ degradation
MRVEEQNGHKVIVTSLEDEGHLLCDDMPGRLTPEKLSQISIQAQKKREKLKELRKAKKNYGTKKKV